MFPDRKDGSFFSTREVVDFFEKRSDQAIMPNLILFEIEENEQTYVIGGYSSHSWSPDVNGDASSFIFNLTDNLRFDEMTSSWAANYYTKAFIVDNDRTIPSENEES